MTKQKQELEIHIEELVNKIEECEKKIEQAQSLQSQEVKVIIKYSVCQLSVYVLWCNLFVPCLYQYR